MKLTFVFVLLSALLLSVFGYPHPEFNTGRYPRRAQFQPSNNFQAPPRIDIPLPKQPPQSTNFPRGNIGGNVDYSHGGLTGTVNGQATLWQSRNGRSDVNAQGHYSRTFTGPARGHQDYGAGVTFTHRF